MKKKILIITIALISVFSLAACGKEDWSKVEEMGEVNIDPNDTESLAPSTQEETTEGMGVSYDKDLIELVSKEENEDHTFMIHECNFKAARDVIAVKGTLHNLTDNHKKTIVLSVVNKKGDILSSSELEMDEDSPSDPSFSIESQMTLSEVDNIEAINIYIK